LQANEFLVVGAGIVGMTTALELRQRFPKASIRILERESAPGRHASGRNSGVLHSGIYYGPGTLKAKVCAEGARRMKRFASDHGITVQESGKVIVATEEREVPALDRLMDNARANGIQATKLDSAEVRGIEPNAAAVAGIHVPSTAVIDSQGVLNTLRKVLENRGIDFAFERRVTAIDEHTKEVECGANRYPYGFLFNCAGAHADTLAKLAGLAEDYVLVPFKGIYYKLRPEKEHLVRANIYPVPDLAMPFLGVHFTRAVNGDVYVGPTAIPALGRENYGIIDGLRIGEASGILWELGKLYVRGGVGFRRLVHGELRKYRKRHFVESARRLVPEVSGDDLLRSSKVGIRPQLVNARLGRLELDFVVERTPTSIHVLNAISPAFTSAFAFSEFVVTQAGL
jgi:L-2-hydroxyglutarate oxidase LhgO